MPGPVAEIRPILYSFRRCPYAIRARLALAAAGWRPGVNLELREVLLQAKPPELLEASAKGTVPVLVLPDGRVLDESLGIMHWALGRSAPPGWLGGWGPAQVAAMEALITANDGPFKHHLDRFKYAGQLAHRQAALAILRHWNQRLEQGGWLLGARPSLVDWALLPFVRQFRLADPDGFDQELGLEPLQAWLARFLECPELAAMLAGPWGPRRLWRSPSWLYHLALRQEWQAARAEGVYRRSTRGRALEEVGFIHLSGARQVGATAARFYGDLPAGAVLLLVIDPGRLGHRGAALRWEPPAPGNSEGSSEVFPHLYGALPLAAVLLAEPWRP
jgi:glutathione S-transferase